MEELEIWGSQEKTEIGGFYMIGPKDPERRGCTAYVATLYDAKEICKAVNAQQELSAYKERLKEAIRKRMNEVNPALEFAYNDIQNIIDTL